MTIHIGLVPIDGYVGKILSVTVFEIVIFARTILSDCLIPWHLWAYVLLIMKAGKKVSSRRNWVTASWGWRLPNITDIHIIDWVVQIFSVVFHKWRIQVYANSYSIGRWLKIRKNVYPFAANTMDTLIRNFQHSTLMSKDQVIVGRSEKTRSRKKSQCKREIITQHT